jgi:hypothetical protein
MNYLEGVKTLFTSDLQFSFRALAHRLFVLFSNVHTIIKDNYSSLPPTRILATLGT